MALMVLTAALAVAFMFHFPVSLRSVAPPPTGYPITFEQTGIAGHVWLATLTASDGIRTSAQSTGPSMVFQEPHGGYAFAISAPNGYNASPASGWVTVADHAPPAIVILFTPPATLSPTYAVEFDESGLAGVSWNVTLSPAAGTPSSVASSGTSITFPEPNGSYHFAVSAPSGYSATPSSGSVTVQGRAPNPVSVVFSTPSSFPTPIEHVFLIIMENEGTNQVYGVVPYETALANTYAWGGDATANSNALGYYAVCHPSAPNYLAITSGQSLQCRSDAYNNYSVNNLGNLLQTAGSSWVAYAESATSPCQTSNAGEYAVRHNPFPFFGDLGGTRTGSVCSTHDLPIANLTADYPYSTTPPAFTFIAPNLRNDGHDTSAAFGDHWLAGFVPHLLAQSWFAHSVVFITWDESYGKNANSGYNGLTGGPVFMVAVSPYTAGVGALGSNTSHYNTLSSVEWLLGLSSTGTGHDGTAGFPAMKGLFNFSGAPGADPGRSAAPNAGGPSPLTMAIPPRPDRPVLVAIEGGFCLALGVTSRAGIPWRAETYPLR